MASPIDTGSRGVGAVWASGWAGTLSSEPATNGPITNTSAATRATTAATFDGFPPGETSSVGPREISRRLVAGTSVRVRSTRLRSTTSTLTAPMPLLDGPDVNHRDHQSPRCTERHVSKSDRRRSSTRATSRRSQQNRSSRAACSGRSPCPGSQWRVGRESGPTRHFSGCRSRCTEPGWRTLTSISPSGRR